MIGGAQQLYHLDAAIPLRINSEASRAAFHHRRKVPRGAGAEGLEPWVWEESSGS